MQAKKHHIHLISNHLHQNPRHRAAKIPPPLAQRGIDATPSHSSSCQRMSTPHDSTTLLDALNRFNERVSWFNADRSSEDGLETDETRILLHEWDEHIAPHIPGITAPRLRAQLQAVEHNTIRIMRAKIRLVFHCDLYWTLKARLDWQFCEATLNIPRIVQKTHQNATPGQLAEYRALEHRVLGQDLDIADMFRVFMDAADSHEANWQKKLAELQRDWPDELTPAIETRLQTADFMSGQTWLAEIFAEIQHLQTLHPGFAPLPEEGEGSTPV